MMKFEIGKNYTHGFIGDSSIKVTWTVTGRTAQTITITDGKETKKCRIIKALSEMQGCECVYPLGQYSMCPILRAN